MHVYHHYTVLVERRDEVAAALGRAGIATAIHYLRPLYRQPALAGFAPATALPVTEDVCRSCLSLPMYPELTNAQRERVVRTIAAYYEAIGRTTRRAAA